MPEYHVKGSYGCWVFVPTAVENDGERIVLEESRRCDIFEHDDDAVEISLEEELEGIIDAVPELRPARHKDHR